MKNPYGKSNCIQKAASLVRGDRLRALYAICEDQKTISTRKLEFYLDKLSDDMKLDGIFLREVSKQLDS